MWKIRISRLAEDFVIGIAAGYSFMKSMAELYMTLSFFYLYL